MRRPRLDAAFLLGVVLMLGLAWWLKGDPPPGLPGEPDLSPYQGAPLLLVYGAPGCAACLVQWRTLEHSLPADLRVLHLAARASKTDTRPADADTARRWAASLGVAPAAVLPADLPQRTLPALVLRDVRGRWRFEHAGALDDAARTRLDRALRSEGVE
ncbi:MAG TPA: hypothetical protein DCM32_01390 [Xanthomonadaceae bacterium]|nr:hypothetical protein [Xanthomonadaceae bacterium]